MSEFKNLSIWIHYESIIPKKEFGLDKLFKSAVDIIDNYWNTAFPKFTLHNRTHIYNIIKIAGDLLGVRVKDLTALECIFIILSAAYHDIGMIYSANELQNISNEDEFEKFIVNNLSARLMFKENNQVVSKDLAEWYCRWNHAPRVWNYLDKISTENYGTIDLKDKLGHLCESHNDDALSLNDDNIYDSNFLGEADLKFCAVLLRICDIMDFDNSRTPLSVYEFLGLQHSTNSTDYVSKIEWEKHLCSDGFKFSHNPHSIEVTFTAGPEHPQVEKNIMIFLGVIEDELDKCYKIIQKSSTRWRDFKLPVSINKEIHPKNYKRGNYSLSLEQKKILTLLTGENLYHSQFVFLRELLQNAIDTVRMRLFHEETNGNINFKPKPIEITTWVDSDGYRWLRVDDFGMGMNEYVITTHLLNKGNSFYSSDYFKIQKHEYNNKLGNDFTPISRFGIGLLSCFILGDKIEINSKSIKIESTGSLGSKEEKIRLSINDLESQYVLQTDSQRDHVPTPMPIIGGTQIENGFRKSYGTTIAIRIKRFKDAPFIEDTFKNYISENIIVSPVDILFNGSKIGHDFTSTLSNKLATENIYTFTHEQQTAIEEFYEEKLVKSIRLKILPLDITRSSVNMNLKGQMVVMFMMDNDFAGKAIGSMAFDFDNFTNVKKIIFKKTVRDENDKNIEIRKEVDITEFVITNFNTSCDILFKNSRYDNRSYYRNPILIHNGIRFPNVGLNPYADYAELDFANSIFSDSLFRHELDKHTQYISFGIIYLQDNLIPDLAVSRDGIKKLGFSIYSNLYFSTKELDKYTRGKLSYLVEHYNSEFSMNEIVADNVVKEGEWDNEKLYFSQNGELSINDIKILLKDDTVKVSLITERSFAGALAKALLQINFKLNYTIENESHGGHYVILENQAFISQAIDRYRPLTFLALSSIDVLHENEHVNSNHPLGIWALRNQELLVSEFETYFLILIQSVICNDFYNANKVIDYFIKTLPNNIIVDLHKVTPHK